MNSDGFQAYGFYSDGPKGWIGKIVMFTKIPNSEPPIYNLGFGDQDPNSGKTDDVVVNNNEDRDVVLATVANTIVEFCNHYGNHYIYAKRQYNCTYQSISNGDSGLWEEISKDFDVYGLKDDAWHVLKPSTINYEAFLVNRSN
jgi:hypothetical protein